MDLLGAIQGAGDAIDKTTGGRAVRGLLNGRPRELLSPILFSDSMGITDPKDSTSGRDLTDAYGLTRKGDTSFGSHAAGFLADTVLSPGNLIGGYGAFKAAPTLAKGLTAGAKAASGLDLIDHVASAGKTAGKFLGNEAGYLKVPIKGMSGEMADAADALGPMYSGGTKKLFSLADSMNDLHRPVVANPEWSWMNHESFKNRNPPTSDRIRMIASSEYGDRVAGEIPKGSRYLGNGAEALAFKTPQGNVIRIADNDLNGAGRLPIPEVLQPYRHTEIGPYTVEHLPFVNPMSGSFGDNMEVADRMKKLLAGKQYDPWDVAPHNMSVASSGNYVIHDGGAVLDKLRSSVRGIPNPYKYIEMPEDDLLAALMQAKSYNAVRNSMSAGAAIGTAGQGISAGDLLGVLQAMSAGR